MMRNVRPILLAAFFMPAAALAQGGHSHDAPNGGQIQKIGPLEVELVVKGTDLHLYLVDANDRKVSAAGYSAAATVLAQGNQQKTVALEPREDNLLAGKVDFPVDGRFRATVTLKSGPTEVGKGRYNLDPKGR